MWVIREENTKPCQICRKSYVKEGKRKFCTKKWISEIAKLKPSWMVKKS